MKLSSLEKAIMKTIVYFDMFEYPLTATETWKWLYKPEGSEQERSLQGIADILENAGNLKRHIERTEGFYHLKGKASLVRERKHRNNRVDRQIKKAIRMAKLFRLIPSIRMIMIASSLSTGNVNEQSDIDFFIVTKKNQLWKTRFFAVGLLKFLRKRPDAKTKKDRFCLSFYVTEDNLNIERASFGNDDIVFHHYVQSFIPLYDPDGLYRKFLASNQWIEKYVPHAYFEQRLVGEVDAPAWLHRWHNFFEFITLSSFEKYFSDWYCNMQLRIMPHRLKSIANIDARVIISDYMLKLHDKDNRHELRRQWHERMKAYE